MSIEEMRIFRRVSGSMHRDWIKNKNRLGKLVGAFFDYVEGKRKVLVQYG